MDKSRVKNFAVSARVKLKEQIEQNAYTVGITKNEIKEIKVFEDTFEVNGNKYNKSLLKHRESLVKRIKEKGFEQVLEEVAYTWFNRLIAIRFMEVNEYLPTGVRVLSSTDSSKAEPDIIREAVNLDFENLNIDLIYKLQDQNNTEELFKYLLIKECNELGKIMPSVFEEIEDFTELLLPENLLQEGSIIRTLVTSIAEEDFKEQVEIIGWLYQYYISEKKDEVFEALKKNVKITKENIPAATQLFTPDWIVKYMVENSLGRLWLESHPDEELKAKWKYYLEEAEQEPEVMEQLQIIRDKNKNLKPEDIKLLDPCMGSGHILVYAFDVFYDIYKSAGYTEREIPKLILEKNLYGVDIDDRAAQLAYFAVMMKARSYNRRIFRERTDLNICSIQESNGFPKEAINFLVNSKETEIEKSAHRDDVEYLINVFNDAKEYGSILEVKEIDFEAIERRVEEIKNCETTDIFEWQYKNVILEKIPSLIKQAKIMSNKYDAVCTNPPYMGTKGMNDTLSKYLKMNFPNSKSDIFAVFIEKAFMFAKDNGFISLITMESWMFLSKFQTLREGIIKDKTIVNLVHMPYEGRGRTSLGISFGTSAMILINSEIQKYVGQYMAIRHYEIDDNGVPYEFPTINEKFLSRNQGEFVSIPGTPIAYWVSKTVLNIFMSFKNLFDFTTSASQNVTGNNEKYLRFHWEINKNNIGNESRWRFYAKGGLYRKWYGNLLETIDWSPQARESYRTGHASQIIPKEFWYKKGITWGLITSAIPSFRVLPDTATFDKVGSSIFVDNMDLYNVILAFLNSKISINLLGMFSTTMGYQVRDIRNLPYNLNSKVQDNIEYINKLVNDAIVISKQEWDRFETSWDFNIHPFLKLINKGSNKVKISGIFDTCKTEMENEFNKLKYIEEEINKIYIDIYELQDELTYNIDDKDITIRKADNDRDIKSFISYAIGCMFGRYSLDEEGLTYAGGDFNPDRYKTFEVDADNVIPITDDEYFEDDIVSRFSEFVKITFSEETLEENLDYIADTLGKKINETSRQTIRRYFLKDFYKDHLQTYQKRPIYWLFDSGKNDGFKALIYMHRYDIGTVARVRTDYLHLLQKKYEAEVNRQDLVMENSNASAREKTEARKKKEKLQKQILECIGYDQVIAHVANQKISIDLDDGVAVNYDKFQGIEVPQGEGKKPLKADLLAKI